MRRRVPAVAVALLAFSACGTTTTAEPAPTSSSARASDSPSSAAPPQPESTSESQTCPALKKYPLHPKAAIPNPCAQATHLVELFRHNTAFAREGFTLHVGRLGPDGLALLIDGDLGAARRHFRDDPLVVRVIRS